MTLIKGIQQMEVSEQRRLPVDNVGTDALTAITEPAAIPFSYYNSGVLTADAGQAAGVVVVAKLTYRNVKNALGDVTGTHLDTSVAFTSTAFTTLVAFPYRKAEAIDMNSGTVKADKITENFANGEYCIDHRTGTLYGVKATTQTSLTGVSYKVEAATSGSGGGGISSEVDITKIGGVAPPLDGGAFTPGTSPVIASGMLYDDDAVLADGQIGAPRVKKDRTQIGADYDTSSTAGKAFNVNPEHSHFVPPQTFTLTNVPNATPDETIIIDMAGYQGCSVQVENTSGTDTYTVTMESSNEGIASTDKWQDSYTLGWTLVAGTVTADPFIHTNKAFRPKGHKVKITTVGAADDADFQVFVYKW